MFFPKTYNPGVIMRKTSDNSNLKDILQTSLTSLPQNSQGHKKQEKTMIRTNTGATKEA